MPRQPRGRISQPWPFTNESRSKKLSTNDAQKDWEKIEKHISIIWVISVNKRYHLRSSSQFILDLRMHHGSKAPIFTGVSSTFSSSNVKRLRPQLVEYKPQNRTCVRKNHWAYRSSVP